MLKVEREYDKVVMIKVTATDPGELFIKDTRAISVTIKPGTERQRSILRDLGREGSYRRDATIITAVGMDLFFKNDPATEDLTYELAKGTGNDLVAVTVGNDGAVTATPQAVARAETIRSLLGLRSLDTGR